VRANHLRPIRPGGDRRSTLWARFSIALAVVTAVGSIACSVETFAARQTLSLLARTKPAVAMESDVELAAAATPSGLKQLEGILLVAGPDPRLIRLLTEAFCGYGAGFVQDDWESAVQRGERDRADVLRVHGRNMLARCRAYAERSLGARYRDLLTADDAAADALLARASRGDATALFWLATAVVSSIGMDPSDLPLAMLMPRVTAILERVVVLAPDLENGQPLMALGAIHAAQSAAVGGDPERGRELLDKASAVSRGRLLLPKVMMARIYAVTIRDEALFTRLLIEVLRTPPSVFPEQRLANEIAHRKARRYLAAKKRWF
jgi:hypothetical protein